MFKQRSGRHRAGAKVGAMSATSLDQAVDQAEEKYRTFRVKLKALITTLESHYEAMIKLNDSQMEATTAMCDLLINTPLTKCAVGTNQTKEEEPSEPHEDVNENGEGDSEEGKPDTIQTKPSARESTGSVCHESFISAGIAHSFDSVIGHEKSLEDVEESFKAMCTAHNDLNSVYAKRYKEWIVGYLEEWDSIIATRIEGRLMQFRQMRQKYVHYIDKVHGLHERVDRQKAKSASPKPRLESKLERNRLKLSGAEEAHHDFARSLISLIEEVTTHYWMDLAPLLHMTIQFNINHSSDMATVMARLEKTDAILKSTCKQHGVDVTGRLEDLKPEPVPEVNQEDEELGEEQRQDKEEQAEDFLKNESQSLESV